MEYRSLFADSSPIGVPALLRRLGFGFLFGDDDDEWTEEEYFEYLRHQNWMHESDERMRESEARMRASTERMEAFDRSVHLLEWMQENLEERTQLGWGIFYGSLADPDDIRQRLQDLDDETTAVYGSFVESFELEVPENFRELFEEVMSQDIEEWWDEKYAPAYQFTCSQLAEFWEAQETNEGLDVESSE